MSRHYRINVEITDTGKMLNAKRQQIIDAFADIWPVDYDDTASAGDWMVMEGEENLYGGQSESEFVDQIAQAIWKAMGRYVVIQVTATYLDDLPCEMYERDQDSYDRLMGEDKYNNLVDRMKCHPSAT